MVDLPYSRVPLLIYLFTDLPPACLSASLLQNQRSAVTVREACIRTRCAGTWRTSTRTCWGKRTLLPPPPSFLLSPTPTMHTQAATMHMLLLLHQHHLANLPVRPPVTSTPMLLRSSKTNAQSTPPGSTLMPLPRNRQMHHPRQCTAARLLSVLEPPSRIHPRGVAALRPPTAGGILGGARSSPPGSTLMPLPRNRQMHHPRQCTAARLLSVLEPPSRIHPRQFAPRQSAS
jgi:hypothetical protein